MDATTGGFTIGTSSTTAGAATLESRVDMSLGKHEACTKKRQKAHLRQHHAHSILSLFLSPTDDLIKANKAPRRSNQRRHFFDAATSKSAADNKPTSIQKSVGQSKAKRQAAVNARRQGGAAANANKKPTAMEIEKEISRVRKNKSTHPPPQQRKTGGQQQRQQQGPNPRRHESGGGGAAAGTAGATTTEMKAPTKKAVSAAVRVMKDFGFQPPKGMDVVISFAPKPEQPRKPNPSAAAGGGRGKRGGGGGRGGGRQK